MLARLARLSALRDRTLARIPGEISADALAAVDSLSTFLTTLSSYPTSNRTLSDLEVGRQCQIAAISLERALIASQVGAVSRGTEENARLAADYSRMANDAEVQGRRRRILAGVAVIVAVGVAAFGFVRTEQLSSGSASLIPAYAYFAGSLVALLAVALPLMFLAERRQKTADELRYLEYQTLAIDSYASRLAPGAQPLLLGTVASRLFGRHPDNDDLSREPLWPGPDQWLAASSPIQDVGASPGRPATFRRKLL